MGAFVVEVCDDGNWRLMVDSTKGNEPFTFCTVKEAWDEINKHYGTSCEYLFRVREK